MLSLDAIVQTHYLISAIDGFILNYISTCDNGYKADKVAQRLKAIKQILFPYQAQIAKTIFDYLLISCLGEARYLNTNASAYIEAFVPYHSHLGHAKLTSNDASRTAFARLVNNTLPVDPLNILNVLEIIHRSPLMISSPASGAKTKSSVSGAKWANIATAAKRYFTLPPYIFIDTVLQLEHNNGTVFNKREYELIAADHIASFFDVQANRDLLETKPITKLIKKLSMHESWWPESYRKPSKTLTYHEDTNKHNLYYISKLYSFIEPLLLFFNELKGGVLDFSAIRFVSLDPPRRIEYTGVERPLMLISSSIASSYIDLLYKSPDKELIDDDEDDADDNIEDEDEDDDDNEGDYDKRINKITWKKKRDLIKLQNYLDFLVVLPQSKQLLPITFS